MLLMHYSTEKKIKGKGLQMEERRGSAGEEDGHKREKIHRSERWITVALIDRMKQIKSRLSISRQCPIGAWYQTRQIGGIG